LILYKTSMGERRKERKTREISIKIDELPKRRSWQFRTPKDKVKYIKTVESICRKSLEYKQLVAFLKRNTDLKRCTVLRNLTSDGGRHYTIEIHHEPFTLFDIVETVVNRREMEGETLSPLQVADEVMQLHYDGKVGLIHLSTTMHQLVHDDKIAIPLSYIYQRYDQFYDEYKPYINPVVEEKLQAKVEFTLHSDDIVSDIEPEFTYISVDGWKFPKIPDEWKDALSVDRAEKAVPTGELVEAIAN